MVKMNGSHIHIMSDFESDVSSAAGIGVSPGSSLPTFARDRLDHALISLIDEVTSLLALLRNLLLLYQ